MKLELLLTFGVHFRARFYIPEAYLTWIEVSLQEKSAKMIFLHVLIDSYYAHLLIYAQVFFWRLLFTRTSSARK